MSGKPRAAKRKASTALATSGKATDPHSLADTMLGWLDSDATLKNKHAKNLLKAFDIVKAELQHRTNVMAADSVAAGGSRDVLLGNVAVPPEIFQQVLDFLPRCETVHQASFVSKAWLAVVRSPQLCHTLDCANGLLEKSSTVTNMTQLLELLKNPQFASLKALSPPDKVQMRKGAIAQIAKACPKLEQIDLGCRFFASMKVDDALLSTIPELFPYLTRIGFSMDKVTDSGVAEFCRCMGERLRVLHIFDSYCCTKKLSDDTLKLIGRQCPDLRRFDYEYSTHSRARQPFGYVLSMSGTGLIALLQGCPKLKTLNLFDLAFPGLDVFEYLVSGNCSNNLDSLLVGGHDSLVRDTVLCAKLADHIKSFQAISTSEHDQRFNNNRRDGKPSIYW